jgi:chromosome segregation ATPase
MTQQPDVPVLGQLREIRATLAGYTVRFDRIEKDLDELRHLVKHALVAGATAELRTGELDEGQERSEAHHKHLDERVSSIEQRVAKIEERLDG